ncbi:MAG: hydroxysqualene dehydroxylase [Nitrospiraceae bacterium]
MPRSVLIIGGGLAGLTVALRLSARGHEVTLLEESRGLGGRLVAPRVVPAHTLTPQDPSLPSSSEPQEALPLVMLGSHISTFSLLKTLGSGAEASSFHRLPLEFLLPDGCAVRWRHLWTPGPFHTLLALTIFRGLPIRDRWRALTWLERTWEGEPALPIDLEHRTADDWLAAVGQSETARGRIWRPLARFLLGEDLTVVSAATLVGMLARCFFSSRDHSAITMPGAGVGRLLLHPARDQLVRSGAAIRLETAVRRIQFDSHGVTSIQLRTGETLKADWYVAALPHRSLCSLLPERVLAQYAYFEHLTKLSDAPALAVHLWFQHGPSSARLLLLAQGPYHWLVSRPDAGSGSGGTRVSLVATGTAAQLERSDQELVDLALGVIGRALPAWAEARPLESSIVREPHAFLSVRPGTGALRPLQQSPFPNFFLAGDWTDTGLPGTMESAIRSGDLCAEVIEQKEKRR